jgi:hypothetical protein
MLYKETPNSNTEIPNNFQIPNPKSLIPIFFGNWLVDN